MLSFFYTFDCEKERDATIDRKDPGSVKGLSAIYLCRGLKLFISSTAQSRMHHL